MSTTPDIGKLPKWAQERIKDLERQREAAVRALNEFNDSQTPSSVYYEDWPCTGEAQGPSPKRKYIQSRWLHFVHEGVEMHVLLRDGAIEIQWSSHKMSGDVCCQPRSWQQVWLIAKENMK